jgi:hypothetical protein
MDPALKTLKAAFEAIRDTTMNALAQIGQSQEEYSMRWKCKSCEYISILRGPFHWKALANAPDAEAQSLGLFGL